jgi:hypothetical protein
MNLTNFLHLLVEDHGILGLNSRENTEKIELNL